MLCAHALLWVALAANPDLEKATRLVADLQYPEAKAALDAAARRPGNDRETLLRIYELQGVVYATLNETAKATKAFQLLLVLDPDRKLSGDHPPRVTTPFYEARGRATELGKLDVKPLPAAIGGGRVGQLAVELVNDPLKLVKKLRFHVRTDGGAWSDVAPDVAGKTYSVATDGAKVEWWVDVLGEREAVLANLGTESAPKVDLGKPPVVAKVDKKPPPTGEPTDGGVTKPGRGTPPLRIVSLVTIGLGVAAIAGGVGLGISANSARSRIDNAEVNAQGQVISITQREAYALDAQVRTFATIANVLFGVGGGLAATGIVLFFVSRSEAAPEVVLLPTGTGLALSGVF